MKILFCIYQLDYADHISIAYLSAVAKKRGHRTYFCTLPDFTKYLDQVKPDIVAYSLNIFGFEEMIEAHQRAVRSYYKFHSIAGGPEVTLSPGTHADSGIDTYCVGEGELAFDDYLARIEVGSTWDDVPNLITTTAINEVRPLIKDLDTIPFPDRDLTLSNSFLGGIEKKTFYATRGCPFACYYCANNFYRELYKGKGKAVRRFSVDRVITEIEYVRDRYRTEFVKFGDDLFAAKADEWLEEFAKKYKKRIGIPYNCFLRFDTVEEPLLKLLKESGCFSVHLSVDSTSEHVRENVLGRKMRKVDIVSKLRLIKNYGINTWVNFMLAAPESKLQDDLDTIELGYQGKVTYIPYTTTVPMRGTRLFDSSVAQGYIDASYVGDLSDCSIRTPYKCFTEKEKDIRYNILLLGPIASRLVQPFRWLLIQVIKLVKPNALFVWIKNIYYKRILETKIFKIR